jgi:hypothetical protein
LRRYHANPSAKHDVTAPLAEPAAPFVISMLRPLI